MFNRLRTLLAALVLAVGSIAVIADAARAQDVRYVSATGSNSNNCTRTAPCRGLNRAINVSTAGGEVQILDSGTFGASVQIKKSITISAVGVAATVGSIVIDAPGAIVALRRLLVIGSPSSASTGIFIDAAAAVHITGCTIMRFETGGGAGIVVGAAGVDVFIARTLSRDNEGLGLLQQSRSTGSRIVIEDSRFDNNGEGIRAVGGGGQVTIERSVISGNSSNGLSVDNGATIRISNSVVTANFTGLQNDGGTLLSRGNNTVSGNSTNTSGTITPLGGYRSAGRCPAAQLRRPRPGCGIDERPGV